MAKRSANKPARIERNPLRAPHHSWASHIKAGRQIRARNMTKMEMPAELSEGLTDIVLGIFTDMVNANAPFQACLLAIYLSGLEHGYQITKNNFEKQE